MLLDALLAIAVFGLIFLAFGYVKQGETIKQTHINEQRFLQSIDTGLLLSFGQIIDTYSSEFVPTADTDTQWGWNTVNNVSPFPVYSIVNGVPYLRFNLDGTDIGTSALVQLQGKIVSNFNGACKDATGTLNLGTDDLYLYCEFLRGLQYRTIAGTVSRPAVLGAPIDPADIPIAIISFDKKDGSGSTFRTDTYTVSYGAEYTRRRAQTANRLNEMRAAYESFTNATKMKEIANVEHSDQSGGLNSADDEFVGWHWKIFGDSYSQIQSTFCNKPAGGGVCSNLDTANIWRSGSNIPRGLISRRFVDNLFGGDTAYYHDAFGNGIYIYPTTLQCATGTDYMACGISALTVPQDDYITIGTPPYISVFYTEPFALKTTAGEPYGRVLVAY